MKLIADSGSTKTCWQLIDKMGCCEEVFTDGINPFYQTEKEISLIITNQLLPSFAKKTAISELYFYGAGCSFPAKKEVVLNAITPFFMDCKIDIQSDLLGAARGLCSETNGIACILGTGSNSCLFEEGEIQQNTSPLGYIIGDEGSGAVLGKKLIGDYLKGQLPEALMKKFRTTYPEDTAYFLERIYKKPFPNRFLASFCPFLSAQKEHPYVKDLLCASFNDFLLRNISQYNKRELPIHFTGSIAFFFEKELTEAIDKFGMKKGKISQNPLPGLVSFHR